MTRSGLINDISHSSKATFACIRGRSAKKSKFLIMSEIIDLLKFVNGLGPSDTRDKHLFYLAV